MSLIVFKPHARNEPVWSFLALLAVGVGLGIWPQLIQAPSAVRCGPITLAVLPSPLANWPCRCLGEETDLAPRVSHERPDVDPPPRRDEARVMRPDAAWRIKG